MERQPTRNLAAPGRACRFLAGILLASWCGPRSTGPAAAVASVSSPCTDRGFDAPLSGARADTAETLRLRGGKIGRRTQPAKVPRQFWTKRYQADWDKLKLRVNRVHDPERGLSRTEFVKVPGSYWAFGKKSIDRAPNMTVGWDIPYDQAHLKEDAMLFHPDTMEPLNEKRIWGDPDDPWHDLRWDERDMDEEVRAHMWEPHIYHPYIAMLLRYQCENDAYRVRSARDASARLMAGIQGSLHDMSDDMDGEEEARVHVPGDEAGIPAALLRLRALDTERRRTDAGAAAEGVVVVDRGVHAFPALNSKQVIALPRGRFSVVAGHGSGGWSCAGVSACDRAFVEVDPSTPYDLVLPNQTSDASAQAVAANAAFQERYARFVAAQDAGEEAGVGVTVAGCWWLEAEVEARFRGLKMVQNDSARWPDGSPALPPKTAPDYFRSGGEWGEAEARRCGQAQSKWREFDRGAAGGDAVGEPGVGGGGAVGGVCGADADGPGWWGGGARGAAVFRVKEFEDQKERESEAGTWGQPGVAEGEDEGGAGGGRGKPWEGQEECEGAAAEGECEEALSCLTVAGRVVVEACDLLGGGSQVVSVREHGNVSLVACRFGDLPHEGRLDPFVYPPYEYFSPAYNQILPAFGLPRHMDGVVAVDDSVVDIERCVFGHTLNGAVDVSDRARVVVAQAVCANAGIGVHVRGHAQAWVDDSMLAGCGTALLVRDSAAAALERCCVTLTKLGVAVHGAATAVVRGSNFSKCRDGAFFSGGDNLHQTMEVCGNSVLCSPPRDTHSGYTWVSLQRPRRLREHDNCVTNDPYYPESCDLEKIYNKGSVEDVIKWVIREEGKVFPWKKRAQERINRNQSYPGHMMHFLQVQQQHEKRQQHLRRRERIARRDEAAAPGDDLLNSGLGSPAIEWG